MPLSPSAPTQRSNTLPPNPELSRTDVAASGGFSLYAGVAASSAQRDQLEHLIRYVCRPPIAAERLVLTDSGHVHYTLKPPRCCSS